MKAEYCVDYLSHQWNTDDLIATYKETCKQRQKYVLNNITDTTSLLIKNEKKYKKSEEYKVKRFQNALWRSMAKNCTDNLSRSNLLINPATVSWQKESDITWLYGPMYTNSNNNNNKSNYHYNNNTIVDGTQSSLQGLKPVLKKQSNVTQLLPSCSDSLLFYSYESTTTTTKATTSISSSNVWSDFTNSPATTSGMNSSRSSFSSISSHSSIKSNSIGVHFNPEIIEIEYQPEYPVSLESSPVSCPPYSSEPYYYMNYGEYDYNEDDNEDEDDALWPLLVQASNTLKSSTYTRISTLISNCLFYYNAQQQYKKKHSSSATKYNHHYSSTSVSSSGSYSNKKNSLQLILLLVSMMKSVFSLTTTWVLYQSLSSLSSLLSTTSSSSKPVKSTFVAAGQLSNTTTPKQSPSSSSKKARLIIL